MTARNADRNSISPSRPLSIRDEFGLFECGAFNALAADRLERSLAKGGRVAVAVFELDGDHRSSPGSVDAVARAIFENVRPSDLAARCSSNTFVALLDRCEREEAKQVCGRILRSVMRMTMDGRLSCGIAVAPTDGSTMSQLLAHANLRPIPVHAAERIIAAAS